MFEQSLLHNSAGETARRSWTTAASITIQLAAISLAVLVPMLGPQLLPSIALPPGPPMIFHGESPVIHPTTASSGDSMPSLIPVADYNVFHPLGKRVRSIQGTEVPDVSTFSFGEGSHTGAAIPIPGPVVSEPVPSGPVQISHFNEGMLVHRVEPVYPMPARLNRIQGEVTMAAIISREGTIANLRAISGNPLLVHAAIDAVQQWRYRPYILNGNPVEVETHIVVNFHLE